MASNLQFATCHTVTLSQPSATQLASVTGELLASTKVGELAARVGLDVRDVASVAAGDMQALARVGQRLGVDPDIIVAITALARKVCSVQWLCSTVQCCQP